MPPITWQNINGPSVADAARPLESAQRSFDASLGAFDNILKKREATDSANWDTGKANNTAAFLDELHKPRTPEEMAALQKSGFLDEMRKGFGAQVDRTTIRTAEDTRGATLQQRALTDIAYNNTVSDQKDAPIRDAIGVQIANKNFAGAEALMAGNPTMRNLAVLAQAAAAGKRQDVTETQHDTTFGNQQKLFPGQLIAQTDTHNLSQANVAHLRAQAAKDQAEAGVKGQAAGLQNFLSGSLKQYSDSQIAYGNGVSALAKASGITLDKTGTPVFDGVAPDKLVAFKASLATLGEPPSSSAYMASIQKRMVDGKVHPDKIIEATKQMGQLLQDGAVISEADAARMKGVRDRNTAKVEDANKHNLFYTDPAKQLVEQTAVIKSLGDIKDGDWLTKGPIKAKVEEWMTKGFPITDSKGRETIVPVPPKLMEHVLALTKETNTTLFNNTTSNAEPILRDMLTSPKFAEMRTQAESLRNGTGTVSAGKLYDSLTNQEGVRPAANEALSRLDSALARATAQANGLPMPAPVIPEKKTPPGFPKTHDKGHRQYR